MAKKKKHNESNVSKEMIEGEWGSIEAEAGSASAPEAEKAAPDPEPTAGEYIPQEEPSICSADMLKPIMQMLGDTLAPAWQIQQSEYENLAGAYGGILDKYFPDGPNSWFEKFGPEITAVTVTATFYMCHKDQDRMGRTQPPEEEKGGNDKAS